MGYEDVVRKHLAMSAEAKQRCAATLAPQIVQAAELVAAALKAGNKIMYCGNGGSAAEAQHMAAEYVGRLMKERERSPLPAIALSTDTSFITACGNDFGFENIFARQVAALGRKGDVLVAISTSGSSPNVVKAVEVAANMGITSIGLTGEKGMACPCDLVLAVPAAMTMQIQECHLAIQHLIVDISERILFGFK